MGDMSDGLNMLPRVAEPETSSGSSEKPASGPQALSGPNVPDTSIGAVALQQPAAWIYDFDPASGSSRATYLGEVVFAGGGGGGGAGVDSFNGRTGAITLTPADVSAAGGASLSSPQLTGTPSAPTAPPSTSTTQIASTAFVSQAIANAPNVASFNGRQGAVTLTTSDITSAGGAPLASPYLTGTPQTPTGAQGAGGSQIASQAYVEAAIAAETVISFNGRHGAVTLSLSDVQSVGGAPIASPNFTGLPSGPTAAPGTATTQLASCAFVTDAITAGTAGVSSVNTRTGAVVLTTTDLSAMGGAPLLSPALTGTPSAPTASAGVATTQLATCAFVANAIASEAAGVTSFNGRTGTVALTLADVTSIGGAPLAAPSFSGLVHSPTPSAGDNSTLVATTAFVDTAIATLPAIPLASTSTPLMNAAAAIGTQAAWSHGDHVHPTDTSRYSATNPSGFQTAAQVTASLAGYVPLAGATMTGSLTAPGLTSSDGLSIAQASTANPQPLFALYNGAANVGYLTWQPVNGQVQIINSTGGGSAAVSTSPAFIVNCTPYSPAGGAWSASSDARIKTVEGDYAIGLAEVLALRPVSFRYKGNDTAGAAEDSPHHLVREKTYVGLVAQDVEPVFPGMVTQRKGFIDGREVEDFRDLNATPLIYALVNAVKTLSDQVMALNERVNELEAA